MLLLASRPEPYGTTADLVQRIDEYLDRYVDVGDDFRTLAAYYILLTWVYDAFNELPYLRFRGDYGSGKTRALEEVQQLQPLSTPAACQEGALDPTWYLHVACRKK